MFIFCRGWYKRCRQDWIPAKPSSCKKPHLKMPTKSSITVVRHRKNHRKFILDKATSTELALTDSRQAKTRKGHGENKWIWSDHKITLSSLGLWGFGCSQAAHRALLCGRGGFHFTCWLQVVLGPHRDVESQQTQGFHRAQPTKPWSFMGTIPPVSRLSTE